jgi:hypothetical protein
MRVAARKRMRAMILAMVCKFLWRNGSLRGNENGNGLFPANLLGAEKGAKADNWGFFLRWYLHYIDITLLLIDFHWLLHHLLSQILVTCEASLVLGVDSMKH